MRDVDEVVNEAIKQKEENLVTSESEKNNDVLPSEVKEPDAFANAPVIHPDDSKKSVSEQAEDAIVFASAKNAYSDEKFMGQVTKLFEQKVLTQQEADSMKKDRLVAEQYYIKWRDVLNLAGIQTPQGMGLMRLVVIIMMIPYMIIRLVDFVFQTVSTVITFFNRLCNAIFGQKKKVQLDEKGSEVAAEYGFNIVAKILFGLIVSAIFLATILAIIKYFTGFDLIGTIRNLINQ